jgi:hypothetical protein
MRSHWLAGAACLASILTGGSAAAQSLPPGVTLPSGVGGGATSTVDLTDGTKIVTTVLSPTSMKIDLSGGPTFGPNPATVNVTNLTMAGSEILYSGNVVMSGATTPFNCTLNTATKAVSGDAICGTAFGGQPASPPTTPVTPPTAPTTGAGTGGTTTTTTDNPDGSTTTTVTTPGGPTITVTQPAEAIFIRNVQAEQFLLSMIADRVSVANAQSYIASRLQQMEMAGLAPSGISIGKAGGGLAAGEGGWTPGVWINANGAYLKDKRIGVDGHDTSAVVGLDLTGSTVTVGAFASYGELKLDGSNALFKSDGWTGGLYGRWSPSPQFRVTATVGAGSQDVLYDRTSGAFRSRGTTDRDNRFGSVSVDSQWALSDRVIAVPSLGVLFASSDTDAYVDQAGRKLAGSDTDLSLGSAGATLFYTASGLLPFVQASLNHQFNKEPGIDRTYAQVGAGFVAPIGGAASVVVSAQSLLWKSQERETRFSVTLRRNF